MARFGQTTAAATATPPAHDFPVAHPAPDNPPSSSRRSLPTGPCNYRDLAFGGALCTCIQFWDQGSEHAHNIGGEARMGTNRSTYCYCGHHACFHLHQQRTVPEGYHAPPASALHERHGRSDGQHPLPSVTLHNFQDGMNETARELFIPAGDHQSLNDALKSSRSVLSQPILPLSPSMPHQFATRGSSRPPSELSLSGLPRIPSVCLLSHEVRERRRVADMDNRMRGGQLAQGHEPATGLGLSLLNSAAMDPPIEPPASVAAINPFGSVPDLHPTLTALDMSGDTIPNTQPYDPEDFIQSATEVATPSILNTPTPDLQRADQAIQDSKKLIETIARLTSDPEPLHAPDILPNLSNSAPAALGMSLNSPIQEQLQQVLRTASPQGVTKLMAYIPPLYNLLNSMPNVANTLQELTHRMDHWENHSFNAVQPEDVQNQFDLYDGRLLELEQRMDEHDRVHQAIDADQSSNSNTRRTVPGANESFGSNRSFQSTASSTLVLAAMGREVREKEIGAIKDRLDALEAAAPPSVVNAWEVEVVLVPFGSDLRGLWFPPDEPMQDVTANATQNSEEWTQARAFAGQSGGRSHLPHAPHQATAHSSAQNSSSLSQGESGWSSQDISDWAAGSSDEWLFAKACASKNLAYKRLQSRGFVRNVTLTGASSRDIQATLASAYHDLLEHLEYDGQDNAIVSSHPGLLASFIPLRKVFRQHKLCYLTPAEMTTSALWSAQFLAAGVMMRVSGGKRRLYVTQREAYMQFSDYEGYSWTWQRIRQLPRFLPDLDSQMEGNDEQCQPRVDEADAKEPCWAFFEPYDLPPASVTSSFSSHHSIHSAPVQLSMRPAEKQWRRSMTPTSILKTRSQHPISPLSEKHPIRPGHTHARTVSTSVIDQRASFGASKRRFDTSPTKHSSISQLASRNPSVSMSRQKRRRVTQLSSSPRETNINVQTPQVVFVSTNEAQRQKALPSPFYSSHPELHRTPSDTTTRSQKSVVVARKLTPTAYATPYSGPITYGHKYGGFGDYAGDTEPDDDHDYQDDDGDISWRGVDDEQSGSGSPSESSSDVETVAEALERSSFSGGDSGFASEIGEEESDDEVEDEDSESASGAPPPTDGDDEEDVLERLLDVLQR